MLKMASLDITDLPISRKAAKAARSRYYFTAKRCKNGHIEARATKSGSCRECSRLRSAAWQASRGGYSTLWARAHPDIIRERRARFNAKPETKVYQDRWRAANPDKVKAARARSDAKDPPYERLKRSRRKNPEATKSKAAAYMREWTAINRCRHRSSRKAWEADNKETLLGYCAKRRAHTKLGRLSKGLIPLLMAEQGAKCPYCLCDLMNGGFSLDHYIPLSLDGAHEDGNIQITCRSCNSRKRNKHPAAFLAEVMQL